MQDVRFIKAIRIAEQGLRNHLDKNWEKEESCKDAIVRFTKPTPGWIEEVTQDQLVWLQYLYIVWRDNGKEIFSIEQYDELFYTKEFSQQIDTTSFSRLMSDYTPENKESYFLDVELKNVTKSVQN